MWLNTPWGTGKWWKYGIRQSKAEVIAWKMRAQLAADVRQEQERIVGCACGGWNRCAFGCMSL
jgi:hypothetical protein